MGVDNDSSHSRHFRFPRGGTNGRLDGWHEALVGWRDHAACVHVAYVGVEGVDGAHAIDDWIGWKEQAMLALRCWSVILFLLFFGELF